jgi:membrane-bound lytic murein transglycosylase B
MRIVQKPTIFVLTVGAAALVLCQPQEARADKFQACVQGLWPSAKAAGVTRATFDRATKGITHNAKVIEQATYQPEYKRPVGEYIDRAVSDKRLATGTQMLADNKALLDQIEPKYGVDRHVLVAIWGMESNYGTQPGDLNVIESLATLICAGNRTKFARPQFVSALKILQRGDISHEGMNGSWAGAMGHTQFIPTTYTAYAVDYDGDGKRDIWGNIPDALASTASYLKVSNWQTGASWGYEVRPPKGFNAKGVSEKKLRSLAEWQKAGFTRVDGKGFPRPADKAGLFAPEGNAGPMFLVLNNFRSLLRYNNATSYALAVGHLSDRLRGGGPFVHPWPSDENRLSLDQRKELQQLLVVRGLLEGEPDGVIGPMTLEAVKTYQRSKNMPVDGFPTLTVLKALRAEG